ncbi:50S ribosomal protein L15e [Candidatus Woesearchaeota archaeon]|nr:50S ribosomal protein L15e [Candidatus Woesearchaeota archaeon]
MNMYQYLTRAWNNPSDRHQEIMQKRMVEWRAEPSTLRIPKPSKLDRARKLGYRAKPGIIVVRQRLVRGGRQRPDIRAGRRTKHSRQRKILSMNYQQIAEQRAAKRFPNTEVLNSYFVAKDGTHFWFEVIMVDKSHPVIASDRHLSWMSGGKHNRRVFRGLTSAARKSRGLLHKGKGAEKLRPSMRAHDRKAK